MSFVEDGRLWVALEGTCELAGNPGECRAIATGRFDERRELCAQLALPTSATDSELARRAYLRWGRSFASNLSGDFAVVVWDPARDELIGAVDSFGVGSLFLADGQEEGGKADLRGFGSRLTDVAQLPGLRRRFALDVIGRYVCGLSVPPARTSFRGIERVGPGSVVTLSGTGRAERSRYWSPWDVAPIRFARVEDCFEAFRCALERSVARRLEGGRSALALSSGLDSTAIFCMARERPSGGDLLCLTGVPAQAECDERSEVAALGSAHGLEPVWTSPETSLAAFREVCRISGEPRYLSHFPIMLSIARRAAELGAGRLLTGLYGDLVGGSVWHEALLNGLLQEGRLHAWWSELRALPAPVRRRRALRSSAGSLLPVLNPALRGRRARRLAEHWWPLACVRPEASRQLGLAEARQELARNLDRGMRELHFGRRDWLDRTLPFEGELTGRLAAHFGLEVAHPFADRGLVALSLGFPAAALGARGLTRAPIRHALAGYVSEERRWQRRKVLFNGMYQAMFRGMREELLRLPVAPLLEPLLCRKRLREAAAHSASHAEHLHLWRCLAVNAWMLDHG